jgi:hypothetical protein
MFMCGIAARRLWLAAHVTTGCLLFAGCASGDQPSTFLRYVIDEMPPGGAECCTDVAALGDINGDGFLDVVIGSEGAYGAGLVWYEYPTWERHDVARGNFTTDGVVVDFDGDGDQDIVIGDIDAGPTWFERTDDPRSSWRRRSIGAGYVHDLRVGDLNVDGRYDVVVTDKMRLDVLEADGGGGFVRRTILERPGEGLEVADTDADGDVDILYSNLRLENDAGDWRPAVVADGWPADTRIQVADIDADGTLDIVLSASEGEGRVAWFTPGPEGGWDEHRIGDDTLTGAHSLRVTDFTGDGRQDVLVAEMHTSSDRRVLLYENDGADWRRQVVSTDGAHNIAAADVDRDGDVDFIGKNYGGAGRMLEYWENRSEDARAIPRADPANSRWTYEPIDTARPAFDERKFGSLATDLDNDGDVDVIAGGTLYINSGKGLAGPWTRVILLPEGDVIHAAHELRRGWRRLVAVSDRAIFSIEALDASGEKWAASKVGSLSEGRTQGWAAGDSRVDGAELLFTHGTTLFSLHVPIDTENEWLLMPVAEHVQEEAVVRGDLDGDGDADLVLVDGDGKRLLWLESAGGRYRVHRLGASLHYLDRLAVADINLDGRLDIVYTEENQTDGYDARVAWLEAPEDPQAGFWQSHTIAVLRSANSLDVTDIDSDGDADVIVAEHTDAYEDSVVTDNFTGVFLNERGGWTLDLVEIGEHSSHLGARTADLDGDGVAEVFSIAYRQSCCVHAWRRTSGFDAESPGPD